MIMKFLLICKFKNKQSLCNVKRNKTIKMKHLKKYILFTLFIFVSFITTSQAQTKFQLASPSNWLFLEGDVSATKHNSHKSDTQSLDSIVLKWSTPYISGQVQPLIGNIIANDTISNQFPYAPNEIAAVIGEKIIIINGTGKLAKIYEIPKGIYGIKGLSLILDTNSTNIAGGTRPSVLVAESMETSVDSIANTYFFTYNTQADTILVNRRFAINMREFAPNIYASIKPFAGKLYNNNVLLYATANTHTPQTSNSNANPPFLRGLVEFNIDRNSSNYPLPDIGDELSSRVTTGPEVNRFQPSAGQTQSGKTLLLLPCLPSNSDSVTINNTINLSTQSNKPYLLSFDISTNAINSAFPAYDFGTIQNGKRPLIRPYLVNLTDFNNNTSSYILATEEYSGIDGSNGTSKLYIFDENGIPQTLPNTPDNPPFTGGTNHYWSVAVGNVDGNNQWLPYFPNNPGNEIIVTQSTPDFAYPDNKLMILRYQPNAIIKKPSPPYQNLFPLDTICTQRINGWVAAVNNFDNNPNGKEEIFLVDGGTIRVLRLRDYQDERFRLGLPFDTLFTHSFENQTIFSVAIADLEGDGKNDLIVTTNDSTYLFGSIIPNSLSILFPEHNASSIVTNYCYGDTLTIKWSNLILSEQQVRVEFQPSDSLYSPIGPKISIAENVLNNSENVNFVYVVDSLVAGKTGYFIVSGYRNPNLIKDTSHYLSFEKPVIFIDSTFITKPYHIGDNLTISGSIRCVDSTTLQISIDKTQWVSLSTQPSSADTTLSITGQIPCLPIFNIYKPNFQTTLYTRVMVTRTNILDSSAIYPIQVLPQELGLTLEPCLTNCPTLTFHWDTLQTQSKCDSLYFLYGDMIQDSLNLISAVPFSAGTFAWNIPLGISDSIKIKSSCLDGCSQFDTLIYNIKPKYINIVSPNPFQPYHEMLSIVYSIPNDANVSMKIIDQGNRVVKEIVNSKYNSKNIVYCEYWNGLNSKGELVANGMYYILLELSDGSKDIYPVFVRK